MAKIELHSVSKVCPGGTREVSDIELAIDDGELLVLVGPWRHGASRAAQTARAVAHDDGFPR